MANELVIHYPTGATLYAMLFDATGQVWNGSAFAAPGSASWGDYDIPMTEAATSTGVYRASMPAAAAGVYGWVVRRQAGGSPAVGDITVGTGKIEWSGTAEVTLTSRATQTSVDDVPNLTEFNARTLASADYLVEGDTLAAVTTVGSVTGSVGSVSGDTKQTADVATLIATVGVAGAGLTVLATASALTSTKTTVDDIFDDLGDVRTVVDSILQDTGTTGVVLADDAITAAKIAADAIGASELAASAANEIAAAVLAGGSGTYSYSSTVDDGSGNLLDGVYVQLSTNVGFTNIVHATHTNSLGAFTVYSDTAGTHYLRLQLSGYTFAIQTVTLA